MTARAPSSAWRGGPCRPAIAAWLLLMPGMAPAIAADPQTQPGPAPERPTNTAPFVAPRQALLLTREMRRALPDGKEIETRRSYRIHIVPEGAGYRVDGELVDSAVAVPPRLAALGELERTRPDTGLFPIRLDATGRIADSNPELDATIRAQALAITSEMIDGSHIDATARADIRRFSLEAVQGANEGEWPVDLFHPLSGMRTDISHFLLPGAISGSVTVTIDAKAGADDGLLRSFERTVVTDAGGEQRATREVWTLSAAAFSR